MTSSRDKDEDHYQELQSQEYDDLGDDFRLPISHKPTENLDLDNVEQATLDTQLTSSNIGFRLLQKMGWKGKGLGKDEQDGTKSLKIIMTTINIDSKRFAFETVVRPNSFKISEIGRKWKTSAVFKRDEAVWIVQVGKAKHLVVSEGRERSGWASFAVDWPKQLQTAPTSACSGTESITKYGGLWSAFEFVES
ncbi:hypothetical protein IFM89_037796 [Coptis chinensis]|uniref:G-patch domain-containing protein n=1 Tax=Coptis chinensis TaxID=261450 RepID=A0A835LHQ7_9MAGN|nr:hypothetical protein IFM89_037796 [Coptis chinensis]